MKLNLERIKESGGPEWRDVAMEAIWDAWYRPLAAYLRSSFRLDAEVEDLMQDIMFKVYRNLEAYDGRHALSTWIYAIARNTCLDWLAVRRPASAALELEPADSRSTEYQVLRNEVDGAVERLLAGLGPVDRSVAWLAFYERAPYRRIAEIHGLPLHAVKNRVFALRRQLKAALEDYYA
jgi:RNA polymerase sigma-70 factor (ECF subfamily)